MPSVTILMAGLLFNDANMLEIVNAKKHCIFQEDRQTWLIEQEDIGRKVKQELPKHPRETYLQKDVGKPEWGIHHTRQNNQDDRRWKASYRGIVGSSILGHILAVRLLNAESLWNWPPLFAYADRFWKIEKDRTRGGTNEISLFTKELWLEWEKTRQVK